MSYVQDGTADIVSGAGSARFDVFDAGSAEAGIFMVVREGGFPAYTGATEVTPGHEAVILGTANKTVLSNITVNPIPSNYGLIEWDGSVLTVS